VLLARGRYIWPCGPWAGGTARGTAFWHGPWAARHGPHRARASTTRRPVRVMGRRPGPDTARARHDQGRGTVADTAPAPRCVTMAVAAAAGHLCCGAPPPRPVLAPGAQDADAPPPCGHVAELHPATGGARESSAPSRRALHPELPTRAEQAHRRLPLTLPAGTAACCPLPPELHPWLRPEAPPPALPDCHALRRRLPVLSAARRALSTARWPMCRVVGRRLGPWHGQARHGDTTRHDAVPTRHGGHL
jgi:hypothetical protein